MEINNNSNPLISVIMNCHNGEKYLRQSIESVISQSYKNWELIFWDNKSNDNSANIFKSYDDNRLKYFYSSSKTTLYKARNLSIQKAQGEFLTFLDTDDFWSSKRLQKIRDFFLENSEINFIYGNYYILNEKLSTKKIAYKNSNLISGKIYNSLLDRYTIGLVSICFKKKIFLKFDERFDIIGDFDAIMKISQKNSFGVIKEPLAFYRLHEKNFSLLNKDKHYEELTIWYNENLKNNDKIEKLVKVKFETQINELKILSLILKKNKTEALKLIFKTCSFLKKIRFALFLILPDQVLKKFINR